MNCCRRARRGPEVRVNLPDRRVLPHLNVLQSQFATPLPLFGTHVRLERWTFHRDIARWVGSVAHEVQLWSCEARQLAAANWIIVNG